MTSTIPPTTRHADTCSCGDTKEHVIAKRTTANGKTVLFWSDGLVTFGMGWGIKGIGNPHDAAERAKNVEANRLVVEEVCLHDSDEIPALIKRARVAVRRKRSV